VNGSRRRHDRFHAIAIPTFSTHQTPHHREPRSTIPPPSSRRSHTNVLVSDQPEASPGPALGQPTSGRAVPDPVPVTGDPVTGVGTPSPAFGGISPSGGGPPRNFSRTTKQNIADSQRLVARRTGGRRR